MDGLQKNTQKRLTMYRRTFLATTSSLALSPLFNPSGSKSNERSLLWDFCTNEEMRFNLGEPFVVNGHIYATDGRSAIRMLKGDLDVECQDSRTRLRMDNLFLECQGALEDQFWFDFKLTTIDQLETDGSANYVGFCPLCTRRSFESGSVEKYCDLCHLKPYRGGDLQRIDRCLIRYRDAVRIAKISGIQVSVKQQRHYGPGTVGELYSTPVIFRGNNNIDGVIQPIPIPVPCIEPPKPPEIRYQSTSSAEHVVFSGDFEDFSIEEWRGGSF